MKLTVAVLHLQGFLSSFVNFPNFQVKFETNMTKTEKPLIQFSRCSCSTQSSKKTQRQRANLPFGANLLHRQGINAQRNSILIRIRNLL